MDQVITFDKSYQQRLTDFTEVLSGSAPACSVKREWGFYLELTLDPNGWQAIWKIDRATCEYLQIPYPTIVIVVVLDINAHELSARVKVLAVQDEISIPDQHTTQLVQLWPTEDQDQTIALNLHHTANSLDMLRFFYSNLFMPWDYEEDEHEDWVDKHLETRLRLYYDMKNGVLPRATGEHLRSLVTEAKRLQARKDEIVNKSGIEGLEVCEDEIDTPHIRDLIETQLRIMEIKGEMDILENPILRDAIIRKHKEMSQIQNDTEQNIWVVYSTGTANHCIQFMSSVAALYPNECLKFAPLLGPALEMANSNDIFILGETVHTIRTAGAFECGGIMRGISARDRTTITSPVVDIMLDFRGENVVLQNLTIQSFTPQCAILVRRGHVTLKNCKIVGDGKSYIHQGIIVLDGGSLELIDCDISKFCTAIVGNSGAKISLEDTEIYDCNFGLKIFEDCTLKAARGSIRDSKEYAICVELDKVDKRALGRFDILNTLPTVEIEGVKASNNVKSDAIINQKCKIQAVADIFEQGSLDITGDTDTEDEAMNTVKSVIENDRILAVD